MSETQNLPIQRDSDTLSEFLKNADHNGAATIANCREAYKPLAAIDQLYVRMIDNLTQSPEFVSGFFLMRAHSSYRGAVRLALSGQIAESYMLLRGTLESALYGHYVAKNTVRQEIWIRRHEDDACLAKMKAEFTVRKVTDALNAVDPNTAGITKRLYEQTIDYGGHPNVHAVGAQLHVETQGTRTNFTLDYFLCGNVAHSLCLKSAARVGICSLDIFYNVFVERYRLLGIDESLNCVRQAF